MYPKLPLKDEENKFFHFTPSELNIVNQITKPSNKLGFGILLKSFQYLGYFPQSKSEMSRLFIENIASSLEMVPFLFNQYKWKNRSWDYHVDKIRTLTGFKAYDPNVVTELKEWIVKEKNLFPSRKNIAFLLLSHLREIKLELPSEDKFQRLVNTLRKAYYDKKYEELDQSLSPLRKNSINKTLEIKGRNKGSFVWLKSPSGEVGLKSILIEIEKLKMIRSFSIQDSLLESLHPKLIEQLYRRCRSQNSNRLEELSNELRYSLLCAFYYVRKMEITDGIIKIFLELVRRIEKKSKKTIEKEVNKDVRKNYNKQLILKKITFAIKNNPKGTIEEVILAVVNLETFNDLANEYENSYHPSYGAYQTSTMKRKYTSFYRRMMKPILESLDFKANNKKWDDLLKGIELIHKYINTNHVYYPDEEEVPTNLLKGKWKEAAIEESGDGQRIRKHYFELALLEKLEKNLKCKEVYVEGAFQFQNPEKDLPGNWQDIRLNYYDRLKIPIEVKSFTHPIQEEMTYYLRHSNKFFKKEDKDDVYIFHPTGKETGLFRVPKIKKREPRPILKEIHELMSEKWGVISLLDILTEADHQVDFSRFFYSSAQREVLTKEQIKERLLLTLFSLGTNIGLKRIHKAANPNCSYKDLLYFKNQYLNTDSLRESIVALTNRVLSVRNRLIWGECTSCTCDGKQFGSWDQNLMADSNPHYRDPGIMVYWHLDTNALCIHSQIKNCNSSEVAAMVEGLVRHATNMSIESNYVDSRGQSEIAFAFCHFLGINLMPRLKRIKYQKLYLPNQEIESELTELKGVLNNPIRWDLVKEQYDEMVKYVSAIIERPEATESILRRFLSYNKSHPTYKAFLELGRACKTIFLCKYLTNRELRIEIHEGLNIVESWNSVNNFLCFGDKGEFQTNDPYNQELMVLSLHLLQNAMILSNTIMIDKVIMEHNLLEKMTKEDFNSLNPLSSRNINPYGDYYLRAGYSFLEAA